MGNDPHTSQAYAAIAARGGYLIRKDRGLIEVRGGDRAAWLNNLVTNVVKTLSPGEGNYAFAPNLKGRTIFDLNILVLNDKLWLDIDRAWIDNALNHLRHYLITEDVELTDRSEDFRRLAVMGPAAKNVANRLDFGNFVPLPQLQHLERKVADTVVRMIRNDYAGLPCVEFILPADESASQARIIAACEAESVGEAPARAVEIFRIEAGIPASRKEISDQVIPPETGRIEEGISHRKGCYLGQEIIERIRSQGMVAKRLVGLRNSGASPVTPDARIKLGETDVGNITSTCWSERLNAGLAMGYLKTAYIDAAEEFTVETVQASWTARKIRLPLLRADQTAHAD